MLRVIDWHCAVPLAVAGSECQRPVTSPTTSTTRGQSALPTYQYRCTECDHEFEEFQSFTDDALTVCPVCGGRLRKVFNAVGVVFKGSGFYRTDSRTSGTPATAGSSSSTSNGSGDSSSSSDSGSGSGSDSGSGSKTSDAGSSGAGSSGTSSSSSSTSSTTAGSSSTS